MASGFDNAVTSMPIKIERERSVMGFCSKYFFRYWVTKSHLQPPDQQLRRWSNGCKYDCWARGLEFDSLVGFFFSSSPDSGIVHGIYYGNRITPPSTTWNL